MHLWHAQEMHGKCMLYAAENVVCLTVNCP